MSKEISTDYVKLVIDSIVTKYECPICDFDDFYYYNVVSHIKNKHTPESIKEIIEDD